MFDYNEQVEAYEAECVNLPGAVASSEYRIEVCYKPWNAPGVRILEPDIPPQAKLHFYKEGTLCLYDWREQPWEKSWRLADTVIPWTSEWILFYELYLLTREWRGESALHGDAKETEPEPPPSQFTGREGTSFDPVLM